MNYYLLFKSLHLISVISWMAGFYIYQEFSFIMLKIMMKKKISDVFKVMERKIISLHYDSSYDFSWIFGLLLIHSIGFQQFGQTWMILKIIFVIFLQIYHFYLGKILK